ncbi:hypothetical protein AB1K42_14630 [Roseibium algicola]|uniref:hypothetical protein n=1 Tax=Roseibium algicola TaxID=2857014 RepID=UPI0034599F8D
MKRLFILGTVLAIAVGNAEAKSIPQDAQPLSDAEQIELMSGKEIKGTFYNKSGKKAGTFTSEWNSDGVKKTSLTPTGQKTQSKTLKWYVKNGQFCDQSYRTEKYVCGTKGQWFKAGGTCFVTQGDKKTISTEFGC